MAFDRFIIAPFETGLQQDQRPWLIMDDAFARLNNAWIFRGRLRKRAGSLLLGSTINNSRFRVKIGTTDGAGNLAGTVPGAIFAIGQGFSIGNAFYTVYNNAAGAHPMLDTIGTTVTKTYNVATGAYVFAGAAALTDVYWYPAQPVMGLTNFDQGPINNQPSYGFDTQFAYVFTNGAWQRSVSGGTNPTFHGTNEQYFWTCNWRGITPNVVAMFVTNFNATVGAPGANDDPMWYLTVAGGVPTWTSFSPLTIFKTSGAFVATARIIVPFKNRLLLLNTIENDNSGGAGVNTSYVNRCRFSHNGSPIATNAWLEPNQTTGGTQADGAGFVDAATEEQIVSAEFIKDRLIVYFERSTYELVYTGNEILPFVWQKINTELGSESTFSTVPFDKSVLTIGNTGVHACNGANVERIDNKIPANIFEIKSSEIARVYGIRDYFSEVVYWTFTSDSENQNETFPNRVLVYNYKNDSWAYNDDCITAFGYFEQNTPLTWAGATFTWETSSSTWTSGVNQSQSRQVLAGNQQGFTFVIRTDITRNAPAMQITNIVLDGSGLFLNITIMNHTLNTGDYIALENIVGTGSMTGLNGTIEVVGYTDPNTVTVVAPAGFAGTYEGGGTAARVSVMDIWSKQWNPYVQQARDVYLAQIDFGVERTSLGQVLIDYYASSTDQSSVFDAAQNQMIMGTGILETSPYATVPFEQFQDRLWHPIYFQNEGECIQLNITLTPTQTSDPNIVWSDFQVDGIVLKTRPTSARLQ